MTTTRTFLTTLAGFALLPLAATALAGKPSAPAGEARALVRRYFEMWNRQDANAAGEVLAADVVGHVNNQTFHGREVFQRRVAALAQAYGTASFTLEDLLVEGDRAAARWRFRGRHSGPLAGMPATGKEVSVSGMNLFRVAGGRIVEIWVNADDLGELEQLGVVKVPQGT
jgi:steroid delta-isomerase-like uncharacterized protein